MTTAVELREKIVRRMEAQNDAADKPEWWRLDAEGRAVRGVERSCGEWIDRAGHTRFNLTRDWQPVHPLSPYLLALGRDRRQLGRDYRPDADDDVPF